MKKLLKYRGLLFGILSAVCALLVFQTEQEVSDERKKWQEKIEEIQANKNDAPDLLYKIPLISAIGDILCLGCVSRHIDWVNDAHADEWAKRKKSEEYTQATDTTREKIKDIRQNGKKWTYLSFSFLLMSLAFELWRFIARHRKRN